MSKLAVLATGVAAVAAVSMLAPTAASAAAKAPVTIVAATKAMSYGTATPALTYTVYGLAKGDRLTRNPTCSVPAHRAAGQYTITCSGAAANTAKYTIRYVSAPLYVTKATLYVGAAYQQKYYGDPDPTFNYASAGFVGSDKFVKEPTCSVAEPHAAADTYAISCTGANAGPNYTITYIPNNYIVAKRPLLVGPVEQTIYYGSPEPAFESSTINLVPGEKLTKEPTCAVPGEHSHVGTYTITCTGAVASSNYQLTVVPNRYRVLKNSTVVVGDRAALNRDLLGQATGGTLRAQLYLVFPYGEVFQGQTLTFKAGEKTLCTETTDEAGYANCNLDAAGAAAVAANGSYSVSYAGSGTDITGQTRVVSNT